MTPIYTQDNFLTWHKRYFIMIPNWLSTFIFGCFTKCILKPFSALKCVSWFHALSPLPLLPWSSDLWTLILPNPPPRFKSGISSSLKPLTTLFLEFPLCPHRIVNSLRARTVFYHSEYFVQCWKVVYICSKCWLEIIQLVKVSAGTWTLTWPWISCSSDYTS